MSSLQTQVLGKKLPVDMMELSKLFKMALLMQDMTFHDFARLHGVSRQFVSQVVLGKMKSPRLESSIHQFVLANLGTISKTIQNYKVMLNA